MAAEGSEGSTEGKEGTEGTTVGTESTEGTEGTAPRTFSQDDVDRIVRERLARQKSQFGDYDALKEKAAKLDEIEEANRTELERAQKAAADAAAERDKILTEAKEMRVRTALLAEVAKPDRKVVDPEAAIQLLDRATLDLDENGVPTNTAAAVDALLTARPFLVAKAGGTGRGDADLGARTGGKEQLSRAALADMSPKEIDTALAEGRLDNVLKTGQ